MKNNDKIKNININSTIYEVTEKYPELINILAEIGFAGAKNSLLRKTVGKKMKIIDGCKKLGIDINDFIIKLKSLGFNVKNQIAESNKI